MIKGERKKDGQNRLGCIYLVAAVIVCCSYK